MAAVTDYLKPGGLKQQKLSLLRSGGLSLRSRCWQGWFFLEALGRFCPIPASLSPVAVISPLSTFLGLQTHRCSLCLDLHMTIFLSLCLCFLIRTTVAVKRPLQSSTSSASFNYLLLQRPHLQIRSQSQAPGVRASGYHFRKQNSTRGTGFG